MSIESELRVRSGNSCELCAATENLSLWSVAPKSGEQAEEAAWLCTTCQTQLSTTTEAELDVQHWRCLNESMWSQIPAIQVLAWRMLTRLSTEAWAQNALDSLYLDEATLAWAQASSQPAEDALVHRDSNGAVLQAGDTVTLIKDLVVKGANFTAKRGTAVRNISLVADNAAQIEGRVNDQHIVILTQFVKRST
ncbi:phosphonoacetate hydrolase [Thiothrix eikelboomii]|uniref:Phosphonoacetate hydrolase n=1 Tax=Thiothrix eikelboomii TaxID=92487 RepID=A0A1T4VWY2_9GAMM|nr:alkylphosphonate utilization protein [Thiothrix eikelboomii]SKA69494.1 phosphonoacetate hydrolase [Thiothrix eikelboomii]